MLKFKNLYGRRILAFLLALVCAAGLLPPAARAEDKTITLNDFGYSDVSYHSAALGECKGTSE